MAADNHVTRLDVAVKNAPAVRVLDRVAYIQESPQEFVKFQQPFSRIVPERFLSMEAINRLLEAVSADEPHRVVGPAVTVCAEPVDGADAGVLEPAGDLGLDQEPLAADRVVGVPVVDLLEGRLAVKLGVERNKHSAQSAACVWAEDAKPLAFGRDAADGIG